MNAVAAIYDALDDEEALAALPGVLACEAGARSAVLQVFSPGRDVREINLSYFTPQITARYLELDLLRIDPWLSLGLRPQYLDRMWSMEDEVPAERFADSAFFRENFAYWGDDTARCLGGTFALESGWCAIGLHRPLRGRRFDPDDIARMTPLMPHFQRLFALRQRLGAAGAAAALSDAAVDAHVDAVFVIDAAARLLRMNAAAAAMIARQDGLFLSRVGLRARPDAANQALLDAVASACARQGDQGGAFAVPRAAGPPLRVLVSPLGVGHRTHALVVVNDPGRIDPHRVRNLRGFHGLSTAEAETVAALAGGLTPLETAHARGVAVATVRTQIRHALRKTDARGIPELVALAATAPASSVP